MFLRIRLKTIEKKLGIKKKSLVFAFAQKEKVTSAYQIYKNGRIKYLNHLKGMSLEEAKEFIKKQEIAQFIFLDNIYRPLHSSIKISTKEKLLSLTKTKKESKSKQTIPVIPILSSQSVNPQKKSKINEWKKERQAWIDQYKKNLAHDAPADEFLNIIEGLTPKGFDKNGKKRGSKDSGIYGLRLNAMRISKN